MIFKNAAWVDIKQHRGGAVFDVVLIERALPQGFLWADDLRRRIYERGEMPWERFLVDLPQPCFFGEQGSLPTRAASVRFFATTDSNMKPYEPAVDPGEPNPDKVIRILTRHVPLKEGSEVIVVSHAPPVASPLAAPHHRVVKLAWASNVPMTLQRQEITPFDEEAFAHQSLVGAWKFKPIYEFSRLVPSYVLAFWEVPILTGEP